MKLIHILLRPKQNKPRLFAAKQLEMPTLRHVAYAANDGKRSGTHKTHGKTRRSHHPGR